MNNVSLPKQQTRHKPVIYFIADEHLRLVKIGTSRKVASRFDGLRNSSAVPLRLLGVCAGGTQEESELHKRFAHVRRHGEWFELSEELAAYIAVNACPLVDFQLDYSPLPVVVSSSPVPMSPDNDLSLLELGAREASYRELFWRAYLGTDAYGVYAALRAAAEAGLTDTRAAALAGFGDARAMPEIVARLEAEGLARRAAGGSWALDVLRVLPPLTRFQAEALPRALRGAHLDFLGLTPGVALPAWWKRVEPSFAPAAARAWGWTGATSAAAANIPDCPGELLTAGISL